MKGILRRTRHAGSRCAGPDKLVEHRPDDRLILERHDNYWGWHPESNIEQLVMRFIPKVYTAASELIDGTVDIVRLSPDLADSVDAAEGVSVIVGESTNRTMVGFRQDMYPAMADPRVRRALNLAIDRQGLVDALAFGRSELNSVTAVNPPHDNPDLEPYPYDPDEARRLLAEAGYPDGFSIDTLDVMLPPQLSVLGDRRRILAADRHRCR